MSDQEDIVDGKIVNGVKRRSEKISSLLVLIATFTIPTWNIGWVILFSFYLYNMKIYINEKEFNVISDENNVIKIKDGLGDLDIQFFKRWENDCFDRKWKESRYGKCLTKIIDFYDDINDIHGTLIGCSPKIDGKSVNIEYEYKELRE